MKNVLFHYSVFNRGGAEQSTLRLMKLFIKNKWKVHLVLNFKGGDLEKDVPPEIKITYLAERELGFYQSNRLGRCFLIIDKIKMLINMLKIRFIKKYDLACIGLQGLSPFFVSRMVNSDKKIVFIRNDIRKCEKKEKIKSNLKRYYNSIDGVVCVSKTAQESIISELPELEDKAVVIHNVLETKSMRQKLENQKSPFLESKYIKVVTVCRMVDKAKGLFRMLEAYERLYKNGVHFEWYFVGDGADLTGMKEFVRGKDYENLIHFEGKQSNPFPYYKFADLVAVLSYYEGLCGVVNEAKVSGAAVIATEFSGIHEQIEHGVNGWIVENNIEAIVEGLYRLITDNELRNTIKNDKYPEYLLNDDHKFTALISI